MSVCLKRGHPGLHPDRFKTLKKVECFIDVLLNFPSNVADWFDNGTTIYYLCDNGYKRDSWFLSPWQVSVSV